MRSMIVAIAFVICLPALAHGVETSTHPSSFEAARVGFAERTGAEEVHREQDAKRKMRERDKVKRDNFYNSSSTSSSGSRRGESGSGFGFLSR
jgi:hypothetical protein